MKERVGKIIAFGDESLSILEEGGGRTTFKFTPRNIKGDLFHDQCFDYPARLIDQRVRFKANSAGKVTSVSVDHRPAYASFMCVACAMKCATMAAKNCACGNTTNSIYKECEACAVENSRCAACGVPLTNQNEFMR